MSRIKLTFVAVTAVLAVTAIAASVASAAVKFEWQVNGTGLASGQTVGFITTVDPESTVVLQGTAFGVATEVTATKAQANSEAQLIGGTPGTSEEVIEFEKVTVVKPKHCEAGNITSAPLTDTIVEAAEGGVGIGVPNVLIKPKSGTVFADVKYTGASCPLSGDTAAMTGSALGEGPQEAAVHWLLTFGRRSIQQYIPRGGTVQTAGFELNAHPCFWGVSFFVLLKTLVPVGVS